MSSQEAAEVLTVAEINRLRLSLLRLTRQIRSNYDGRVTPSQLAILASIRRHGPSTVGQLADHERVQAPSASRIIATLEQMGMVTRTIDPTDRRCALIDLTADGRRYLAQTAAPGTTWLARRLATLSDDEKRAVQAALPALEQLLEADR